ncbi:MAG: helix-turn-helix domain-containing protein [Rhodobacteraceae bacterium]|nr:helix-turn-helix domain-containing protein [Paracoccaceae bacterium]
MTDEPGAAPLNLLAGWISREDLAEELMVKPDTLARWEARREGPPCMRIGRKVYYRQSSVRDWLLSREQSQPKRKGRGRR